MTNLDIKIATHEGKQPCTGLQSVWPIHNKPLPRMVGESELAEPFRIPRGCVDKARHFSVQQQSDAGKNQAAHQVRTDGLENTKQTSGSNWNVLV
jgi:hypothetical protein